MSDLTVIYITVNKIPPKFAENVRKQLFESTKGKIPIVSVSRRSLNFGDNIISDGEPSHVGIYRDILKGAKYAKTKYIAIAEDDTLYGADHFAHRPHLGKFAYNVSCWGLYTWVSPATFSFRERRNNSGLVCERDLYIEALQERFEAYPDETKVNHAIWAEPGKYESQLGVTVRQTETFYTNVANIMFSHPDGLSWQTIGNKKRMGELRAYEIPGWPRAEEILKLYE